MKKQLPLLVCLLLAAIPTMAQAQATLKPNVPVLQDKQAELQTWKRYTVDGEKFSVSLPTVPAMTTRNTLLWQPRKTRRERELGAYADGAVYFVYVRENITGQSVEDFIRDRDRRNRWDLSTETTVTAGNVTGKQYTANNKNLRDTAQFFVAEGRLYEFSVTGHPEDAAMKQFFSSIVVGKKADGINVKDGEGLPFSNPTCDEVLTGKQVGSAVRLVMKPEPSYTEEARQNKVVGTIILKVIFSCNGTITNINTLESLPHGLTEQAIAALKKIKFVPAVKDGKYVSMWMQLEYNFNLY